jgi:uncharacterized protein YcfJ
MNKSMMMATAGGALASAAVFSLGSWFGGQQALAPAVVEPVASAPASAEAVVPAPAAPVPVVVTPGYAEVLDVVPVKKSWSTPREVCEQVTKVHEVPQQDPDRVTGKLLGAVIGGVVGHQFGDGRGKDAATAGGAILGGMIGDKVQRDRQQAKRYTTTENHCYSVNETQEKIIGYDVSYRYDGRVEVIRLGYQPETRVPVRDARLVFEPWGGAAITPVTVPVGS